MSNKLTSLTLLLALICTLAGTSASAAIASEPSRKANAAGNPIESGSIPKKEAKANENLRADMLKLLEDAKAGKVAPTARPQIQPAKSNSLSKSAKIAIGVGIAVLVIALIVKYQKDHLFDDFNLNGIGL